MSEKLIRNLIFAEKIMCIHRNNLALSKIKRHVTLLRTVLEMILYFYLFQNEIRFLIDLVYAIDGFPSRGVIYQIISLSNTTVALFCSWKTSGPFLTLIQNISTLHSHYRNDVNYTRTINKLNKTWIVYMLLFCSISLTTSFVLPYFCDKNLKWTVGFAIIKALDIWSEFRVALGSIVVSTYMTILYNFLNKISITIDKTLQTENLLSPVSIMKELSMVYNSVAVSSECINKCFRTQVLLFGVSTVFHYTVTTYRIVISLVKNVSYNIIENQLNFLLLINYTIGFSIMAITGQRIRGKVDTIRKQMARLYNCLLKYNRRSDLRTVKDFSRLISMKPAQILLISSLRLDVSLLPMMLGLVIYYIITVLQLNHVL